MATYTDPQLTVETLRDKLSKNPTREIDVLPPLVQWCAQQAEEKVAYQENYFSSELTYNWRDTRVAASFMRKSGDEGCANDWDAS